MRARNNLVYGVGINDADYAVKIKIEVIDSEGKRREVWQNCHYYTTWRNLLSRCYNNSENLNPTYEGCSVCEDWLTFSKFKAWMETQDWKGKQLDKDLLIRGNKVYSPENCIFISKLINSFINEKDSLRGKFKIGVCWHKPNKKYLAQCNNLITKKGRNLGYFNNEEDAHQAWLKKKLEIAHVLAAMQDDPRVAKALIDRYTNYC